MSDANLELVRRAYTLLDNDLEGLLELCSEDVEFVNPDDAIEPGTRHGHDGARAWFASFEESFHRWEVELVRVAANGDLVAGEIKATMYARDPGLTMHRRFGHVWTVRDGKIARFRWLHDPDEAFREAGLDPGAD